LLLDLCLQEADEGGSWIGIGHGIDLKS
jgi:hypothetical protein